MKRIFTMLLALTLLNLNYSCSDDGTTNSELQSINDPLKTVSLDQIKNFNQTSNSQRSARSLPNEEIQIFYEDFIDSNAQFAFELLSFTDRKIERNIYFEYEGEVLGYKMSMFFKEFNFDYTGDLYIENLKTEETSLYVFESGVMTEAYDVIKNKITRSSRTIASDDETEGYIETVTLSVKPIDKDEDRADGNVLSLSSFSLQGNSNAGVGITGGGGGSSSLKPNNSSISLLVAAGLKNLTIDEYIAMYDVLKNTDIGKAFEIDYRKQMSQTEKEIFDSLTYPQQVAYLYSAYEAKTITSSLFSSGFYNGKADAFRHTLWNALVSNRMDPYLAESLTTAHEHIKFSYSTQHLEKQMDLFNNKVGINIGQYATSIDILSQRVLKAFNEGKLVYLNNLDNSGRATIDSELVPTNQ